jgi:hypothetical protein
MDMLIHETTHEFVFQNDHNSNKWTNIYLV